MTSPDLTAYLDGDYSKLNTHLREFDITWNEQDVKIDGHFYYLAFADGNPTVQELVTFLEGFIVRYCIPRRERLRVQAEVVKTGDTKYLDKLLRKAKDLFVRDETTGEPGELLVFILMEAILKAPQMLTKMSLKDNPRAPVLGSDGIHVRIDEKGNIILYWAEAKLDGELSRAFDRLCESLQNLDVERDGRTQRKHELTLLVDNANVTDDAHKEYFRKYLDPYETEAPNASHMHVCLVGWDYGVYGELDKMNPEEREQHFRSQYEGRIRTAASLLKEKFKENKLDHFDFHVFLIPFPEVSAFRTIFVRMLGK
jgi:hypothetical protein